MPLGKEAIVANRNRTDRRQSDDEFRTQRSARNPRQGSSDAAQVGGILGNASLKYLLEAHVRCLLGTDADGVEHSDIVKEYQYAASLIAYWNQTDPSFRERSGNAGSQTLFDNVRWHLSNMSSSAAVPY